MDDSGVIWAGSFLCALMLIFCVAQCGGACAEPEESTRALASAGYRDVVIGDNVFVGCGEGDVSHLAFTATNPRGDPVSGTVCCGWMKACTVRF